jgi:hypothetical protein
VSGGFSAMAPRDKNYGFSPEDRSLTNESTIELLTMAQQGGVQRERPGRRPGDRPGKARQPPAQQGT